jgi:DNA-binding transcriptional LysR family regulator
MSITRLRVAYDAFLPGGRYAPLFHILHMERPDVCLEWQPLGFPSPKFPLLQGADVGLRVHSPPRPGISALTIDLSPMVVLTAAGHRLAQRIRLSVADILNEPFLRTENADPDWSAFWTLDDQRGGPPKLNGDCVKSAEHGLRAVAAGQTIVTVPAWATDGLPHPGVVSLLLSDGPWVATRLLWRSEDRSPIIHALVDLADDLTRDRVERAERISEATDIRITR